MFDADTTALLRAVLEEVCENISVYETCARTHVASKILEAASNGQLSIDELKSAGQQALNASYDVALISAQRDRNSIGSSNLRRP
ncbi:hypothetical protein FDV58_39270 [Bradyrhizobium elkanii]|uniref:Uncharacterized protein n=1 Tax=Bradyrhizobium elkanii TaxID=29448 RepID=A0A4U6RCH9_BRAEL|nr:hypothetical protein [Bradyrhizobium elkanii]TKV71659.1 hypothetical protein FDV58_39270 [Bradyrhizobium elkanii]